MSHHHTVRPEVETYDVSPRVKTVSLVLMVVGAVLFGLGVFTNLEFPTRIWTTLLHNSYYFLAIGMTAMFYVTAQTIGYSGWVVLVSRIPEAMGGAIPVMAVIFGLTIFFGVEHIYEWAKPGAIEHDFTGLIGKKQPFLSKPFFFVASLIYLALWVGLTWMVRSNSYAHDTDAGIGRYLKAKKLSMLFLFVWAITSSTAVWHWFMSIDPHWFSTLYGWYTFCSAFVAGIAMTTLIVIYLKSRGHLKHVNDEHIHDLGKWMFAFSVAWTYLWFSQFMLIWYANIPEETGYFFDRFASYKYLFFANFVINFLFPFLLLMTARAKRQIHLLSFVAVMVLIGHWIDYYLLAFPGAVKNAHYMISPAAGDHHSMLTLAGGGHGQAAAHGPVQLFNFGIGPLEIGAALMFLGLFLFLTFRTLSKHSLVPVNHPFVKESIEHQTHSI